MEPWTFKPSADWNGEVEFSYGVSDSSTNAVAPQKKQWTTVISKEDFSNGAQGMNQ